MHAMPPGVYAAALAAPGLPEGAAGVSRQTFWHPNSTRAQGL